MSPVNSLNKADWKEWLLQTAVYSIVIPVAIAFCTGISNGVDPKAAGLLALYALNAAVLNLLVKYKSGITTA